jgi:alanine racemase
MRSWIEVSRSRIRENFRAVRKVIGDRSEIMPVVKADAYRHGSVEVSRILESEGARWLAVSNAEEGVELRNAGITARILVMADYLPETRELYGRYSLTPVIHSLEDVATTTVPYHLKIDSGMGRLGTRAEAAAIAKAVGSSAAPLEGLMTHFASAADYSSSQTEEQISQFERIVTDLRVLGVSPPYMHLSSTLPVAYGRGNAWGKLVRPGLATYGYVASARGPAPHPVLDVQPALTWKASVLAVKDIEAGAPIGYGALHRAALPMRIAILAAGYADGIPHRLSNRGHVIAQGKLLPIVGAISMDMTTIDASSCPSLKVGDAITLLGSEGNVSIDAQQIANVAETIPYNILCGIHTRVKRVYTA